MSEARFAPGARVGVLLPMPFDEPLDYTVPEGITLAAGDFVSVELGARQTVGVVWGPGGQGAGSWEGNHHRRRRCGKPLRTAGLWRAIA